MRLTADKIMALRPDWPQAWVETLLAPLGYVEHGDLFRDSRVRVDDREWLGRDLLRGDDSLLRRYASDCAEHALSREREAGREPNPRSVSAVEVARRYTRGEATDQDLAAAQSAARAAAASARVGAGSDQSPIKAAESAAWPCARSAWTAAESAAWSARAAAGSTGWDAEREWQVERLIALIDERESCPPGKCLKPGAEASA